MTRIELGGEGSPIPTEALPDNLLTEDDIAPLTLVLSDGNFAKADYVGLGYTNYEVWCIGAAGGRGGDSGTTVRWLMTQSVAHMTDAEWEQFVQAHEREFGFDRNYLFAAYVNPATGEVTYESILIQMDRAYPGHNVPITTFHDPFVVSNSRDIGGGGGGGGLHRVSGLLADLPALVPVVVGQAGDDALPGQDFVNGFYSAAPYSGPWVPYPTPLGPNPSLGLFVSWFRLRYPAAPTLQPPQVGEDGGASSFGAICKASGGKGGGPSIAWAGGVKTFTGFGGAGGSGNSLVAGGGGLGATTDKNGKDGTWDGTIGKGGGGGRGGKRNASPLRVATSGGQGSFNYGDTSVFGQRGLRSNYINLNQTYDPNTGEVVTTIEVVTGDTTIPGGGGGAKAPGSNRYGSRASGYSPNGLVLIKIYKI